MNRIINLTTSALLVAVVLTSCKKDPVNNLMGDEARIYITNFDSTVNFRNFHTYSIADSVAVISDDRLVGMATTTYDLQALDAVKQNMQERGFTLVDKNAHPDLGINVSRITSTQTGVVSYRNYWDDYGSYYDPYYWGYSGYGYYSPYSYGVYQIKDGALSVDILNLKDASANGNKINTVWSALARGNGVFNTANAATQVNAFFSQSAYLKTSL